MIKRINKVIHNIYSGQFDDVEIIDLLTTTLNFGVKDEVEFMRTVKQINECIQKKNYVLIADLLEFRLKAVL